MIAAILPAFAEIILALLFGAVELSLLVISASIRPWRYALSPSFRQSINAQYAQSGALQKWFALTWGTIALSASIALIVGAAMTAIAWRQSAQQSQTLFKAEAARKTVDAVAAGISKRRESKEQP